MELMEYMKMTREERLAEVGTEPPCPFCQRPRVSRSDYIRCNRCGINWLNEEMELPNYLERNPAAARQGVAFITKETKLTADMPSEDVTSSKLKDDLAASLDVTPIF